MHVLKKYSRICSIHDHFWGEDTYGSRQDRSWVYQLMQASSSAFRRVNKRSPKGAKNICHTLCESFSNCVSVFNSYPPNATMQYNGSAQSFVYGQIIKDGLGQKPSQTCVSNMKMTLTLAILYGDDQPPATSTHSGKQLPCLPSTSTISVSHLHLQPTPFSTGSSHSSQ